jgi:hypothetical protein
MSEIPKNLGAHERHGDDLASHPEPVAASHVAPELLEAAKALRAAQRNYMADRGNEAKGKLVAEAAQELDAAILKAEGRS